MRAVFVFPLGLLLIRARPAQASGLWRISRVRSSREAPRSPRFLRYLRTRVAFLRPRRSLRSHEPRDPRCCLPLSKRRRPPLRSAFRGSITQPAHSLSTLRRDGRPSTTQDSLAAGAHPLPRETLLSQGTNGRFRLWIPGHSLLLPQASPGALAAAVKDHAVVHVDESDPK
jgi:hypothetical protein